MYVMASNTQEIEDSDEVFIDHNTATDKGKTIQRLKEFSYYLVEEIEVNLEFCLKILEERKVPVKPASKYVFALSKFALAIPYVGSGLSNALPQIENFFLNRIDVANSKTLGDLVYFYNDNKKRFREIMIEATIETFCSFENQFRKLNCNGGERRAMQKLAKTAAGRIINYLLDIKQGNDMTKTNIIKGILEGDTKTDRTIKDTKKNLKTSKLFTKTGLVIVETSTFYRKSNSNPEKYGHRKAFHWETKDEIEKVYEVDSNAYSVPTFILNCTDEYLINDIREYIMTKDPFEEAKLDREQNTEKLSEETTKRYEEIVKLLNEHFQEVLKEMEKQFRTTSNFQETHTDMLDAVLENQEEDKKATSEIQTKLELIKFTVEQTAENQNVLIDTTTVIKEDVNVIKENQIEISEKHKELKKAFENRSVKNELKEVLKENDPTPKLKKEIERTTERAKTEVKKLKLKLGKRC